MAGTKSLVSLGTSLMGFVKNTISGLSTGARILAVSMVNSDGDEIAMGPATHLKTVQVAALDATNGSNDLATHLGGTVLADAIAGTLAGFVGYKLAFILMTVETNDVRISFDDADPATNGGVWKKDSSRPHCIDVADFTKVRIVAAAATAKVTFQLFA